MADEKGLDYYLANPDEMPEDINALAQALDASPEEPVEAVEEKGVPADAEEQAEEVAQQEESTEEDKEEPPLIETKQGKPAIPYAVLQGERERRQAAEHAAEQLRRDLDALSAKFSNPEKTESEEKPESPLDGIERLAEEFPEIGAAVKALASKTKALESQLAQVAQVEQMRIEQEQKRALDEVQEAIDSIPQLRYWQAENPQMWAEAARLDDVVKANPANQSLSLTERFEKVVSAMEALYGVAELPDAYKPIAPKVKQVEQQVAAKAPKPVSAFKPKMLSDIPGGSTPPTSETDRVSAMSPVELERLLSSMDADQLAAFIAKAA